MKIVLIDWFCDSAYPGASGLSDLIWGMADGLADLGHDIHIVAPYTAGPPSFGQAKSITIHTQKAPKIGYRNIIGNLMLAYLARQIIGKIKNVDIIHAVEYTSTGVILQLDNCGVPVVLTTPGNIYERIDRVNHFDWTVTLTYKWAARVTAQYASAVIATSQSMQRWWEFTGTPPQRIIQIPLGVDTDKFAPNQKARETLELGSHPMILFVGRLQEENGAEQLIRAFSHVVQRFPDCKLHFIGNGPDKPHLQSLAIEIGIQQAIIWHGVVSFSDLPLYYAAADVFACPRISRVTPRVLFEAMSSGTPVVASKIDGIVDFTEHDATALLFDYKNIEQFAESLVRLLEDRMFAKVLGKAARAYARENFDWRVVNRRICEEVYIPVANKF